MAIVWVRLWSSHKQREGCMTTYYRQHLTYGPVFAPRRAMRGGYLAFRVKPESFSAA